MVWTICTVVAIASLVTAIKVPVVNVENVENDSAKLDEKPIQYISDESLSQGYLLPPIPYKSEEMLNGAVKIPATFLLPPSSETMIDYYTPSEPVEQHQQDWYPIAPGPQQNILHGQLIPKPELQNVIVENIRAGKVLQNVDRGLPPIPATVLLPPLENAQNYYFNDAPSTEKGSNEQNLPLKYKPTGLYPKKVIGSFNPMPIPIAQFADNSAEIPKAKPIRPFRPQPIIEGGHLTPSDEKKIYLFKQEEQKRKLKKDNDVENKNTPNKNNNVNTDHSSPIEQESSENVHRPKHDSHPASANQIAAKRPVYVPANKGERTEFRMHGMNGPHSYQFGFDTGKGKNRQFRYEERDNDGHVRGHYGYVDKLGKLRVVNYDADPKLGFRADPPVVQE